MFVDESGSFDSSLEPSRFYIVTLLCHDQSEDIKPLADELESQLGYLGYPDTCIHAGPLLRREEDFRAVDDGQDQVKDLLKTSFARLPVEFKADVLPDKYRLFQAADLICTIELLAIKHEKNLPLNKSEEFFFGKWRDLKKNYLAPLRRLAL